MEREVSMEISKISGRVKDQWHFIESECSIKSVYQI